jgi:hypothetical protein
MIIIIHMFRRNARHPSVIAQVLCCKTRTPVIPYVFTSNLFPYHISLSKTAIYGGQYHAMDIYLKISKIT